MSSSKYFQLDDVPYDCCDGRFGAMMEPATGKQLSYIAYLSGGEDINDLAKKHAPGNFSFITKGQASEIIDALKAGG